jgi:hypothetical protein
MRPGDRAGLEVELADAAAGPLAARTYAADVYTIVNGGFGGRLHGESQTGATRWLDYRTETIQLRAGERVRRPFTIAVPVDAEPGEHITSIVLENETPIRGTGSVALDQVVRQAIAVVVTVPGPRVPAMTIGAATHEIVAGRSVVSIAVANPGNVRLKPLVAFALTDAAGGVISHGTVQMDTFYAWTDTTVELSLAALLTPGSYTVRVSLEDLEQRAHAEAAAIAFVVAPPSSADDPIVGEPGPRFAPVDQVAPPGTGTLPLVLIGLGLALTAAAVVVLMVLRRRTRGAIAG